jgi:hypothetical protein
MEVYELLQFAYKNKLYLTGRMDQVTLYLKELALQYRTLKEYLEFRTREL